MIGSESNREKKMSSGHERFQLHDEFVLYAGNVKRTRTSND
jgi:hypothetical protein